jgi:hypothetical protein
MIISDPIQLMFRLMLMRAVARVFRRGDFACNWQANPRPGKTGTSYNIFLLHLLRSRAG